METQLTRPQVYGTPEEIDTYLEARMAERQELQFQLDRIGQQDQILWDEHAARPWTRFVLVVSSDGHVHKGAVTKAGPTCSCSTMQVATEVMWLPRDSGASEAEVIARHGEKVCTDCYPDAPTNPFYIAAVAAAAKEKADGRCTGSGEYAGDVRGRVGSPWASCRDCGRGVAVTRLGKLRCHQTPEQEAAEIEEKRLAKNAEAGRCQHTGLTPMGAGRAFENAEREMKDAAMARVADWPAGSFAAKQNYEWRSEASDKAERAHRAWDCQCGKSVKLTSTGKVPAHKAA